MKQIDTIIFGATAARVAARLQSPASAVWSSREASQRARSSSTRLSRRRPECVNRRLGSPRGCEMSLPRRAYSRLTADYIYSRSAVCSRSTTLKPAATCCSGLFRFRSIKSLRRICGRAIQPRARLYKLSCKDCDRHTGARADGLRKELRTAALRRTARSKNRRRQRVPAARSHSTTS